MIPALGLDLGNQMGWAVLTANKTMRSGTVDLIPFRSKPHYHRFVNLRIILTSLGDRFGPFAAVYYENITWRHKSNDASYLYHGYKAILMEWCGSQPVEPRVKGIIPQHIKIVATGKGNASKKEMELTARLRGWKFQDDNECDALWTLWAGVTRRGGT